MTNTLINNTWDELCEYDKFYLLPEDDHMSVITKLNILIRWILFVCNSMHLKFTRDLTNNIS